MQIGADENDGAKLFSSLTRAHTLEDVSRVFGSIEGP